MDMNQNPAVGPLRPETILGVAGTTPAHPPQDDDPMHHDHTHSPSPWIANIDILYKVVTVILLILGSYIAWQVESRVNQLENRIQGQLIDFERRISERFTDRRESEGMENRIQRLEDRQWPRN